VVPSCRAPAVFFRRVPGMVPESPSPSIAVAACC